MRPTAGVDDDNDDDIDARSAPALTADTAAPGARVSRPGGAAGSCLLLLLLLLEPAELLMFAEPAANCCSDGGGCAGGAALPFMVARAKFMF